MALNLKDLGRKPGSGSKTESAASVPGKTAGRPWEVQSWEKPAEPKSPDETGATSSDEQAPSETAVAAETAAPEQAADMAQDAATDAASDAASDETVDSPTAETAAATSQASEADDDVPMHRGEERRGSRGFAAEGQDVRDSDNGVDDVLSFVEELKVKLRNSQRSKHALEDALAASKTKVENVEELSAGRAREIALLHQEIARLKGECDRQLAELCRSDEDRAEGALALKRMTVSLNDARTQIRAREDEIGRLKTALANNRKVAEEREQLSAAAEAESAKRWRKFEEQLNQKDRDLFKARATIDELKQQKDLAEARIARLEGSRAAIDKIRAAVQAGRERRDSDSDT